MPVADATSRSAGRRPVTAAVLLVLALAAGGLLAACSGTSSSITAFCDTLEEHALGEDDRVGVLEQGDLSSAASTPFVRMDETRRLIDQLLPVAPEEIRDDLENVRDAIAPDLDAAGQPAGEREGLAGRIDTALGVVSVGPAVERIDRYARENCGQGVFSN